MGRFATDIADKRPVSLGLLGAAAGIIPVTLAYIGDNFPYEKRQAAIGKYLSAL